MVKRIFSRIVSVARQMKDRIAPTAAHRRWVEAWIIHGGERELDIIDVLVDPRRAALDVGANGGVYTSRLANIVPQVLAIEPNPDLCKVLRRARYANVRVVEAAVSDRPGTAELNIPLRSDGKLSLPCATLEPLDEQHPGKKIKVRLIRLDEYADMPIGLLKIDIEGHELSALQGARQLFANQRPNAVIEVENCERSERIVPVVNFFASMEYRGFFLGEAGILPIKSLTPAMQDRALLDKKIPRRNSLFINNFIFLPSESAAALCERIAVKLKLAH